MGKMEDVVFVSEKAFGKRRRDEDDDEAVRKRVQVKNEDESTSGSSSESEGDDDSDVEPNARVRNAMSAVRIPTEPQATQSQDNLAVRIKSEGHSDSKQDEDLVLIYLDELQDALRARFPNATFTNRKKVCRNTAALRGYVKYLEYIVKFTLTDDDPVRQATIGNICKGAKKRKWTDKVLNLRIAHLRKAQRNFPASHPTAVAGQSSQDDSQGMRTATADVHAMREEISDLKDEVRRRKSMHDKLGRTFAKKKKLVEDTEKANKELESVVRRREAEIAILRSRSTGSTSTAESQEDSRQIEKAENVAREASKAAKGAEEAAKAAQAKANSIYKHYDSVQKKNTVLIGKLRMMAKAGGLDGPDTAFRKELDALKAPELTELNEYEEQE
ncbi:hypothetical protein B5807_01643 [Epicoccum nigrum]|uniref:Uncharacterized protein n=1 Tax=Epicoccum nigrum TaxID=105696 RepID=A0A1Y2MCD3_EPING|nr:hypothetical protein B5807_01643 [Epicoccum nigrum]